MTAMTAPLAPFLTRFSAPPPTPTPVIEVAPSEPTIAMHQAELDAMLEAAMEAGRSEAEQQHAMDIASLATEHEARLAEVAASTRAEWAATAGDRFATLIDQQLAALRTALADGLTRVLIPLLADSVRTRTIQALTDAIDRLLSDPGKPAIQVTGPDDLLGIMRTVRPAPGIEWIVADEAEVTITAGMARIETRLAAALGELAATENTDVG